MAEEELRPILQGNNQFAFTMYHKLAANNDNIFFSPIIIHSAVTLMSQDPWFLNKQAFNRVLKVHDVNEAAEKYKDILALFNTVDEETVLLSNKIFFKDNYKLYELFRTRVTNDFLYEVNAINFHKNEAAANLINSWIEDKTFKKMKNLMNPENLDDGTRLALLNALHSSNKWAEPFNPENTVPATFYINDNETVQVQMMNIKKEFYYKNDMFGYKVLELPYANSDISLVVILPNSKTGINGLNFYDFMPLSENMVKQEVNVSLPKFKIEESVELKYYLSGLGLEDAFNADFSGVIKDNEVNLKRVQQKAFIDVKEEGSETASGMLSYFNHMVDHVEENISKDGLIVHDMNMKTDISNRFAKTKVIWKIKNNERRANTVDFKVVLTETAFITEFVMEIKEKIYKSYIKEKEVAKSIYNEALASGISAGLVEAKARDSKEFTVSINIEPETVAIFSLTYEEMLERRHDRYELVLNICPGQIVENLNVVVEITESRPLLFVKTPPLRCGDNISTPENQKFLEPSSEIVVKDPKSAIIKFRPDSKQQKKLSHYLGKSLSDGLSGQFVVQYDVDRDPKDGEVLLQDGYFVHFFAPNDLEPLPKHVVFVLDTSGSMGGRKIEQLKDAMRSILDEIKTNDMISIIEFNNQIIVWDITSECSTILPENNNYLEPFKLLSQLSLPDPTFASDEMKHKAKIVVQKMIACGGTCIIGGLQTALYMVKIGQDKIADKSKRCQPIIIFLTDGEPNVILSSTEQIVQVVTNNNKDIKVPIFSLSFGFGPDKSFLRKLSLKNQGFSRHIYEASDASLQLQEFYKQISSPLLSEIKFMYDSEVEEVTRTYFPIYFRGSELVVSGRYRGTLFPTVIDCCGSLGPIFIKSTTESPTTSLERLWAYLTVKQLLQERDSADDKTELTKKAIDLALKYSFVTDVTSLVVVKPNETNTISANDGSSVPPQYMNQANLFGNIQFQRDNLIQQQQSFMGLVPHAKHFKRAPVFGSSAIFGSSGGSSAAFGSLGGPSAAFGSLGGSSAAFGSLGGSSPAFGSLGGSSPAFGSLGGSPAVFGSSGAFAAFGSSGGFSSASGSSGGESSGQHFGAHYGRRRLCRAGSPPGQSFGTPAETASDLGKKQTEEFLANHPFLIFLKYKKGNKVLILFNGRILKPVY